MANIIKESAVGFSSIAIEDEMLQQRKIFFVNGVDSNTMNELLKQLMYLEFINSGEEITLYINSPGGECVSGLAVFDFIKTMKSPIKTVCVGTAASMGAILFLSGQKREMMKHTKIMIHDPSFGSNFSGMKPWEIEKSLEHLKEMQSTLCDIISQTTGKFHEEVLEVTKDDSFFGLDEALNFGLATGEYKGN